MICVSQLILKNLCLLVSTYIYWRRSIIFLKIFRNLYKSKGRWIRPLLLLTKRTHPPRSGQILESSSAIESLEVEFAPELQRLQQISHLDSYSSLLVDDSGQVRSSAEDPSKGASTSPKQYSHSSRQYAVDLSSSDHYLDYSNDIPFQYAEEVDTFRRILKLPEPRESLPRSSTVVMCLDDEKGRQNLDQEVLPPCCLSIQSLRMPLINLIRTSKQQIYLRVSTSNHLLPLSSGTS